MREDWKRMTRFLESVRIALAREIRLWETLQLENPAQAKIRSLQGNTEYQVTLDGHRFAISDEPLMHGMVLLYSYALAESGAAMKLGKTTADLGVIESWSDQLVTQSGNDWNQVLGGKQGIVEVAVYRNAIGHGCSTFEDHHFNRVDNAGGPGSPPSWHVGDTISLDYETLKAFRSRLKSLLRVGEVESPAAEIED